MQAAPTAPFKSIETPAAVESGAIPYILTRIYEGNQPFLAIDQDSLGNIFKPLVRIEAGRPAGIRFCDLQKVAEAPGRNGMGIFLNHVTGEKFCIKKTSDAARASNEILCASLARAFGVNVPNTQAFEEGGQHYIASEFIEGLVLANERFPNCAFDPRELARLGRACPDIHKAYVAATVLNNRDILGMGLDNLGFTDAADGGLVPHFVDFGGSGAYRATAGKKVFDENAKEFSTMTEPQLQADEYGGGPNGLVFGGIARPVLQASLDRIMEVGDEALKAMIARHIPDAARAAEFTKLIIARRAAIQAQLFAGSHDRFEEKLKEAVDYGISGAYEWDTEDPKITARLHDILGRDIAACCEASRRLMADGSGQLALSESIQALVGECLDRLLVGQNGARMTRADQKRQIKAAAQAEAAARPAC